MGAWPGKQSQTSFTPGGRGNVCMWWGEGGPSQQRSVEVYYRKPHYRPSLCSLVAQSVGDLLPPRCAACAGVGIRRGQVDSTP